MNLKKIDNELDRILDKKYWSDNEASLYLLLESKLIKYLQNIKEYKLNKNDKTEITNNFNNTTWFNEKPIFYKLLESMYIKNYKSILNDEINYLKVSIHFKNFIIIMKMKNTNLNLKFERTITIYNISNINEYTIINTDLIPNYKELNNIFIYNGCKFTPYEIYNFLNELITYYMGESVLIKCP